jgi:CDGSH-type Zn-finger protein
MGIMPVKVLVREKGPLVIEQDVEIIFPDGSSEIKKQKVSFCRCCLSEKKPYCDGNHKYQEWDYEINKGHVEI